MTADNQSPHENFVVVRTHPVDAYILGRIVRPLAELIPARVTPNQITMVTPIMTFLCFACAAASPLAGAPNIALMFGLLSALFCFGSMLTDHLDGMHARNTGQTSKLGEILDHWVDSFSVTILVMALPVSMGATGPLTVLAVTTGAMIYHTQLLVYRTTGKFLYPPTGSAASAALLAVALSSVALLLRVLPRGGELRDHAIDLVLVLMTIGQLINIRYYFRSLKSERILSAAFLAVFGAIAFMYLKGLLEFWPTAILWVAVSFRMSGSLVLFSVTKASYRGFDPLLLGLVAAMIPYLMFIPSISLFGMNNGVLGSMTVSAYVLLNNAREFLKLT